MTLRRSRQRGLVVLSLLLLLALVGLITGTSLWFTRAELWAAGRARSESQAAYTAAAGLRHALAVLAVDVDWEALLDLSPAALSSVERPGPWLIGDGGWVDFPGPPFGYEVRIVPPAALSNAPDTILVHSNATAVRGASLTAIASLARAPAAYAPAALVLAGGGIEVEPSAYHRVALRGSKDMSALGANTVAVEVAAMEAAQEAGVRIDGSTLDTVRMFDVRRFAARSGLPSTDPAGASFPRESPLLGAIRLASGVLSHLAGVGVVVVEGPLEIRGPVDLEGVLLVAGELRLSGEPCRVAGMVWAHDVAFAAGCTFEADGGVVRAADEMLRMPRLPILTSFGRNGRRLQSGGRGVRP